MTISKRRIQNDLCLVGTKKVLARFMTFRGHGSTRIRYEVRSGREGKGRTLGVASCTWGYKSETQAFERLKKKLGGIHIILDEPFTKDEFRKLLNQVRSGEVEQ